MPPISCFLISETDHMSRALRRFRYEKSEQPSSICPINGYHNARTDIGVAPIVTTPEGYLDGSRTWPHEDPRWPRACACGYVFDEADEWQLFVEWLYRRVDGSPETFALRDAPPGAMWYADWMLRHRRADPPEPANYQGPGHFIGPDGRCLYVMLPGGHEWCIDAPASNGPGWTRTGIPPLVTARPSIGLPGPSGFRYHAFLTDGVLTEV